MPELPEVEITKRKLLPLVGKRILSFTTDWPRGLLVEKSPIKIARDIRGRKILAIRRHGKVLFLDLGKQNSNSKTVERILAFHLRMSGRLFISTTNNAALNQKHVRTKIKFTNNSFLYFKDPRKFGTVWYGTPEKVSAHNYIALLGPDALSISYQDFVSRTSNSKTAIKPLLLNQSILAGVGNIVVDETLWKARIHPQKSAGKLSSQEKKNIYNSLKMVLRRSIKAKGSTLRDWSHPDGTSGNFQNKFWIYGRKNLPCLRCKNSISRIVVGSRGTWICEECQHV